MPDNKNLLFHEGRMGGTEDGGMGEIMECVEKTVLRSGRGRRRARRKRGRKKGVKVERLGRKGGMDG